MKASELRNTSPQELTEHMLELLKEQFNLRMQNGSSQLSKNHQLKIVRRSIARVKTLLGEQEKQGKK